MKNPNQSQHLAFCQSNRTNFVFIGALKNTHTHKTPGHVKQSKAEQHDQPNFTLQLEYQA